MRGGRRDKTRILANITEFVQPEVKVLGIHRDADYLKAKLEWQGRQESLGID